MRLSVRLGLGDLDPRPSLVVENLWQLSTVLGPQCPYTVCKMKNNLKCFPLGLPLLARVRLSELQSQLGHLQLWDLKLVTQPLHLSLSM